MSRMSTTSFLDNPVLKVSRTVAACSRCRTAKIKCDGKLPACSACEKSGRTESCSNSNDEFAKGKERSYIASLEAYCERLEKQIAYNRERQSNFLNDGERIIRESSIASFPSKDTVPSERRKEVSDIDDLVGDFGFLSVNATSRDFQGIKSNASFANLLLSVSSVERLPQSTSHKLPGRREATPVFQYYFDNIFVQLPFFVETSFWASVTLVYQSDSRFAKPFDHWIVRMVLATTSASLSQENGDAHSERARGLVSQALQYSEEVLRPGSILCVQAILLLAQYSLIDPTHFRCWYLTGMAARVMADLGLHQDPPSEVLTESDRLELRRRVFHCLYCLDRSISSALYRSFSFSDASVNVALPDASSPPSPSLTDHSHIFLRSTAPAFYIVKIRQILSESYQEMFFNDREPSLQPVASIWTFCAKAREWLENAPKNVPQHFPLLYRLELLYTTMILLSPCPKYHTICDFAKVLLFDRCMDYVNQLHQVLENPSALPFLTIIDIHRAHQIGSRFVEILNMDYELALHPNIPTPPPVSPGTPNPPYLGHEDRINCLPRAIRCIDYVRDILQHGARRWGVDSSLRQFEQASASIRDRLTHTRSLMVYPSFPESSSYVVWHDVNTLSQSTRVYSY